MRRALLSGITFLLSLTLSLAAAELLLRASGRTPSIPPVAELPRAAIHEPDPTLGWRSKPGAFVWPDGRGGGIRLTFWEGGRRATAPTDRAERPEVVIVGCSLTQGWAVSDEGTYAWKLQEQFPELRIVNLGTAGYGTYQSLLAFERYLAETADRPALVIYAFSDFHEMRNVASATWLRSITDTSDVATVKVPFASLGSDGTLRRRSPEAPPAWPLRRQLASVAFLERTYTDFHARGRIGAQRWVTELLLVELARRARERGAPFLVTVLAGFQPEATQRYMGFMERNQIAVVDCQHPKFFEPGMKVPGYGHPNAKLNAYWATCIAKQMRVMGVGHSPTAASSSSAVR